MRMSERGKQLLAAWEGVKLRTYFDSAGHPTIGCGHKLSKEERIGGKFAEGITKEEALELLAADLAPVEQCINRNVTVALSQHQFDALCSFAFNVGTGNFLSSTLLKRLLKLDYAAVPNELMKWTRAGGGRSKGLVVRREKEIRLWRGEL